MMAPLPGETDVQQWDEKIGISTCQRALKPLALKYGLASGLEREVKRGRSGVGEYSGQINAGNTLEFERSKRRDKNWLSRRDEATEKYQLVSCSWIPWDTSVNHFLLCIRSNEAGNLSLFSPFFF